MKKIFVNCPYLIFMLVISYHPSYSCEADTRMDLAIDRVDSLLQANLVRVDHDLTGEGITVAVISDSFNCLGGAEAGQANDELPPTVTVLKEADCQTETTLDEGRAMLEVIHDIAPKAHLLFHAMGDNPNDLTQAVNRAAEQGAQIIVDDAAYFSEPMFQDGPASQAIDRLVAERGIAYFTSVGNAGLNSYQSAFMIAAARPWEKNTALPTTSIPIPTKPTPAKPSPSVPMPLPC